MKGRRKTRCSGVGGDSSSKWKNKKDYDGGGDDDEKVEGEERVITKVK